MVMNLPTMLRSAGRAPSLSYTLAFAQGLRKITENLSQGGYTVRVPDSVVKYSTNNLERRGISSVLRS
jgi:hypothetical protein